MYSGLLTKNFPEYGKYSPSLAISSLIILGSSKAGPSISLHSQAPCPQGEVAQSCLTLCNPMDCSPPGSSVHGIFQARILEWIAISFSRESSQPRDQTWVSCIAGRVFTVWATREFHLTPQGTLLFLPGWSPHHSLMCFTHANLCDSAHHTSLLPVHPPWSPALHFLIQIPHLLEKKCKSHHFQNVIPYCLNPPSFSPPSASAHIDICCGMNGIS